MSERPSFIRRLEQNGCYGGVVSVEHLDELGAEIRSLHSEGLLDNDFYRERAGSYFKPKLPRSIRNARSIIVVAVPTPLIRTTFLWKGFRVRTIVPPTYCDVRRITWRAKKELKEAFEPNDYRCVKAELPLKLLAVRSGLARYGRNNITYIPRYGSFHRLTAFYSDYECTTDNWSDKRALPLCKKCKACTDACPTNAIQKDRFLIRAERCLTLLNEKDAGHGFPDWVDTSAHNSIVGCMLCQRACPYNKNVVDWCESREEFSEEETAYLLRGRFSNDRASHIKSKLQRVGLSLNLFPRNLKALLDKEVQ
ncbi:MAG: 4Fe-4S binding protein [Methanobacteriota archaeon]|nr:MAG: 4Fe-4S binding protein [Euryarchaeota archaeon]